MPPHPLALILFEHTYSLWLCCTGLNVAALMQLAGAVLCVLNAASNPPLPLKIPVITLLTRRVGLLLYYLPAVAYLDLLQWGMKDILFRTIEDT